MALHIRPIPNHSFILRAYDGEPFTSYQKRLPYRAVCIVSITEEIAYVGGLTSARAGALDKWIPWLRPVPGSLKKADIKEMIAFCRMMGAKEIHIERSEGHRMPFAKLKGDLWVIQTGATMGKTL